MKSPGDVPVPTPHDDRPYVIKTYDRWIILLIVLVGGWFLFRPVFAEVCVFRGNTFESQLVDWTAEHYYKKAIAIDPAVPDGWIRLGELYYYFSHGDPQRTIEAANTFAAGMKAAPNDPYLPFDLGRVELLRLHDYHKAEAALRESIRRNPQTTPVLRHEAEFAWDYLGYAALHNGERKYAIECWQQVLKIDPDHTSARDAIVRAGG
ncbi:MAG TPA: tetratricopeptide repeat protein [Candidatus Eremiobacteraceae bacterium]|nr:tetratricopeptide repeat protein [Candidatus Eremiobacteraceae bacterium]